MGKKNHSWVPAAEHTPSAFPRRARTPVSALLHPTTEPAPRTSAPSRAAEPCPTPNEVLQRGSTAPNASPMPPAASPHGQRRRRRAVAPALRLEQGIARRHLPPPHF